MALHCAKVASEVLVASHLCIQSCSRSFGGFALHIQDSKGFGGSASVHTNQVVDFWWIYLFVGVIHKLQRV